MTGWLQELRTSGLDSEQAERLLAFPPGLALTKVEEVKAISQSDIIHEFIGNTSPRIFS